MVISLKKWLRRILYFSTALQIYKKELLHRYLSKEIAKLSLYKLSLFIILKFRNNYFNEAPLSFVEAPIKLWRHMMLF